MEIVHDKAVYRSRGLLGAFGPYVWRYPRQAWACIGEVMPWEALVIAAVCGGVVWLTLGKDLGAASGMCTALGLATVQMLSTRTVLSNACLSIERGLLISRRRTLLRLAEVAEIRVLKDPSVEDDFADILLVTDTAKEHRLRAVSGADRFAQELAALKVEALKGAA